MGLYREGMEQAKEALGIFERLGGTVDQARCLTNLALLLHSDGQFDAAEEAAFHAIDLLPEEGEQLWIYRVLGNIYRSKGDTEKTIHHLELALGIASSLNWHTELFWIHYSLAEVLAGEGRYDDAHTHIERAKSHGVNDAYGLACASWLQSLWWGEQRRFEEAKSEALCALDVFEKLGAANDAEVTRRFLQWIDRNAPANGQGSGYT